MAKRWYVVHVYSGFEKKIAQQLKEQAAQLQEQLLDQLKEIPDIGYGLAYQNLLNAANERLNRPLKNGFRMAGQLGAAKLDSIALLADGVSIALRVSGDLKILYGM